MVCPHVIILIHEDIEYVLCLGLLVDEVVSVGDAMAGLIALTIITQESGKVPCLIATPGFAEE